MSSVDAVRLATSIRELGPNRIPFVLSSMIWPFAVNWPKISEIVLPVTRLMASEVEEGW